MTKQWGFNKSLEVWSRFRWYI